MYPVMCDHLNTTPGILAIRKKKEAISLKIVGNENCLSNEQNMFSLPERIRWRKVERQEEDSIVSTIR